MKVGLEGDPRIELRGEVVAFDRFWMRVKLGAGKGTAREGLNVVLDLPNLEGEPPIHVSGIVWRATGDGLITVLLSLSGQEFGRLQGLVSASTDSPPVPPSAMPGLVSLPAREEASGSSRRSGPRSAVASSTPEPESPARSAEPEVESSDPGPASEEEAREPSTPEGPRRLGLAEEASLLAARGDYEGAARLCSEALRETPGDVSLWYALGAALHRLRRRREAGRAFEQVIRYGRSDCREVRLARLWLERAGVSGERAPAETFLDAERSGPAEAEATSPEPDPEPSETEPTSERTASHGSIATRPSEVEGMGAPAEPGPAPLEPSLAQRAAMLEAQGEYQNAAKLYYQALHASPQDMSLWYALGAIMHRLNQPKAAARAFEKVVEHGRPDSREVQLARLWLEGQDVLAGRAEPVGRSEPERPQIEAPPARSSSGRQAALLAARGEYEGATRRYYEAFQQALGTAPDDALLWYALGVTLQHLHQGEAAARAFEKVLERGRRGSREVRLAQLWLELGDAGVGPVGMEPEASPSGAGPVLKPELPAEEAAAPPAEARSARASIEPERPAAPSQPRVQPSGRGGTARRQASSTPPPSLDDPWELGRAFDRDMPTPPVETPVKARPSSSAVPREEEPRVRPSSRGPVHGEAQRRSAPGPSKRVGLNPPGEAALLAARGDYEEAARLYSEALQGAPEDISLWYSLGVTLHHLRRSTEAAEAFEYVVRHARRGSREARLARVWLERGGIRKEPGARS